MFSVSSQFSFPMVCGEMIIIHQNFQILSRNARVIQIFVYLPIQMDRTDEYKKKSGSGKKWDGGPGGGGPGRGPYGGGGGPRGPRTLADLRSNDHSRINHLIFILVFLVNLCVTLILRFQVHFLHAGPAVVANATFCCHANFLWFVSFGCMYAPRCYHVGILLNIKYIKT